MEDQTGIMTEIRPVQRLTPAQVKADYNLVLQAMGGCMEKDKDYGVIPGTDKPTLFKPGAEKLALIFKLAGKPTTEDLSTPDEIRYRVTTEIIHTPSGTVVGYGVGEASTNEGKYKWRKAFSDEWNETPEDRRRKKYGMGRDGKSYATLQVRTEPADLANTVLKMADKRSLISGILKVTAASSVFSQDLEDMDADVREAVSHAGEGTMPPIATPQRKSEAVAQPQATTAAPAKEAAPATASTAPSPAQQVPTAPDFMRAMASKISGGSCTTCGAQIDKGEEMWFDTKNRRAHCKAHFA